MKSKKNAKSIWFFQFALYKIIFVFTFASPFVASLAQLVEQIIRND